MKKKELKNLAKEIARAELSLRGLSDPKEKRMVQEYIIKLSNKVTSLEDIAILDELIQKEMKSS